MPPPPWLCPLPRVSARVKKGAPLCPTPAFSLPPPPCHTPCARSNKVSQVHVRVDTLISAPPADVFAVISNSSNAKVWTAGMWFNKPVPAAVGDRFKIYLTITPFPFIPFPLPATVRSDVRACAGGVVVCIVVMPAALHATKQSRNLWKGRSLGMLSAGMCKLGRAMLHRAAAAA